MRKVGILGQPVLVPPGSMAQLVLLVLLNVIPCLVLACLKPYVYRGDAYFAYASYALNTAAPFLQLIMGGRSLPPAADGILTALLLVALIIFVLPDQLIERFEARVCRKVSTPILRNREEEGQGVGATGQGQGGSQSFFTWIARALQRRTVTV